MNSSKPSIRNQLYHIIFEAETPSGKAFDVILLISILLSVGIVMLDSVSAFNLAYGRLFYKIEWFFTVIFSIEYILRLWVIETPKKYALSPLGLIDLLAIIPTFVSVIFPGSQYLLVIRLLRVLRVFRILKLVHFVKESAILIQSLKESARKIVVFIFAVLIMVMILGALIYSIEGGKNGFTSIPKSIYWAVVTLTTVGYGDIAPGTTFGQFLATIIMLLGYGIIAVPAGIVTSELTHSKYGNSSTRTCPKCAKEGLTLDAKFCENCGHKLPRMRSN